MSLGASVLMAGCGATDVASDESAGALEQPFGISACSTVAADATYAGFIDPRAYSTSNVYNNCTRSYVVDISNLSSTYTGAGAGGGQDAHFSVTWEGTVPTTQASCEAAWGGGIFYKNVGGTWVDQSGQVDAYGTWINIPGLTPYCQPPVSG